MFSLILELDEKPSMQLEMPFAFIFILIDDDGVSTSPFEIIMSSHLKKYFKLTWSYVLVFTTMKEPLSLFFMSMFKLKKISAPEGIIRSSPRSKGLFAGF